MLFLFITVIEVLCFLLRVWLDFIISIISISLRGIMWVSSLLCLVVFRLSIIMVNKNKIAIAPM